MHNVVMLASNSGTDDIAAIIILPVMFTMVAFIVWVVVNNRRRGEIMRAQTEMQNKLLDKFGTAPEMAEYLQSDAGQKFLESATIEKTKPYGRILGAVMAGIILLSMGLAFLFLRGAFTDPEDIKGFTVAGAIFFALGAGFVLSSVAAFVLSKSWGLFNGDSKPGGD